MVSSKSYSTQPDGGDDVTLSNSSPKKEKDLPGTIFNSNSSAWDHVFENITDLPPLLPPEARGSRSHGLPFSSLSPLDNLSTANNILSKPQKLHENRRVTMTAREISRFDVIFDMLFDSLQSNIPPTERQRRQQQQQPQQRHSLPSSRSVSDVFEGELGLKDTFTKSAGGGDRSMKKIIGGSEDEGLDALFGKISRSSKRVTWTTAADEELDRKREEMSLCETDEELMEWAIREVFGESKRYEEAVRSRLSSSSSSSSSSDNLINEPLQLQPPSYPFLLASLMRTFRDKYSDPHLALSMFDYARHLSVPSYVFGCTTPAYNELVETRWRCFRDLKGVCDALEEMKVNAVPMDARTRALAETVRSEVGERTVWAEESPSSTGETGRMVKFLDTITAHISPLFSRMSGTSPAGKSKKWRANEEIWKSKALNDKENEKDGWQFGDWDLGEPNDSKFNNVQHS
ncbi:hypothetical protein C8Q75DRAFT_788354 [Abortiporus biennis]|nr:hypothetical protein C8Q75DRAFT_788354 [Abortiporus biennis]